MRAEIPPVVRLYRWLHPRSRAAGHTTWVQGATKGAREARCIYCDVVLNRSTKRARESVAQTKARFAHERVCSRRWGLAALAEVDAWLYARLTESERAIVDAARGALF